MSTNYKIWAFDNPEDRNFCILDDLVEVEDDHELKEGVSRLDGFPGDVEYFMDPDYPNDVELADSLMNSDSLIVVSLALREFIESKTMKNIEFLPVTIVNHKGKPASSDYSLLNPIILQNCINPEKSGARWSTLTPDRMAAIKRLVIDEDKIDKAAKIFRPTGFSRIVVVEVKIADEILAAGFTGIRWVDINEYPER